MFKAIVLFALILAMLPGCSPAPPQSTVPAETQQPEITLETPQATPEIDRGEPDFENSYWGNSMEEVRENESAGHWILYKLSSFAGIGADVRFVFGREQNDILLAGEYLLYIDSDPAATYETARAYLVDLHGEPLFESFDDNDNEEVASITEAIECGGDAQAAWTVFDSDGKPVEGIQLFYRYGQVYVTFQCLTIHPGQNKDVYPG